jgi:pseudouridine-5'-phosphate glycosidase
VPVLGYRTDEFPAFCVRGSGGRVSARVESPAEAAAVYDAHVRMGGRGAILVQPVDEKLAVSEDEFSAAMRTAEAEAAAKGVRGADVTPYLLSRLAELTDGKSLAANRALIVANARLGAEVAVELARAAAG